MSYETLDVDKNINPFIKIKELDSYSRDMIQNIKLLTFFPKGSMMMGSNTYAIQKYPGDIDLMETFYDCCTKEEVIDKYIKALKRVVYDIIHTPEHYLSEFKAGLDYRYNINIGTLSNGVWDRNEQLKKYINWYV